MVDTATRPITDYDELKFSTDTTIVKALAPNERILLSTVLYKYNRRGRRQERSILITTKAIYNVNKQDLFASIISVFSSSYKIRRRIDITKLSCISISDFSSEFVLHVADEYDYRYSSIQMRAIILMVICKAYYMNVKKNPLKFAFIGEINLTKHTTTREDKKNGVSRIPLNSATVLDEQGLNDKLMEITEKNEKLKADTEMVFLKSSTISNKITLDDFEMLKVLGRGAYGKVMLVEKKDTKQVYAMKSLHKDKLIGKEQLERIKTERFVLEQNKSPFLVGLEFAFQTPEKIFFIMKFMKGGELFQHLRSSRRFDEKRAKFYAAEIVLGLEYLHSLDIVYRDLKPENVLLDEDGHVCLTDFGMAKGLKVGQTTSSFVGTPEYLAPEIIQLQGHAKCVDWWTLGVLICEMIQGAPPYYNKERNMDILFNSILTAEPNLLTQKVKISLEAKDLIQKLLVKNPEKRLGSRGAMEIKSHPWFADIDWKNIALKKVTPPFKPKVSSDYDVNNFDREFTEEEAYNSVVPESNVAALSKYQKEFQGFSYVPANDLLSRANK